MDSTFAIQVDSLSKTYRSSLGRRQHEALRGVSLEVKPGRIFGLLGPNGAGKTTLLKVLLGILRPSAGSARILGEEEKATGKAARVLVVMLATCRSVSAFPCIILPIRPSPSTGG